MSEHRLSVAAAQEDSQVWPGLRDWLRVRRGMRSGAVRAFFTSPGGVIGLALLVVILFIAAAADWLYPGDPLATLAQPLLWPGQDGSFPLGTDFLGRDVAAEIAHGARTSLIVGVCAMLIGMNIGTAIGALSGYFGGRADRLLVRITELFQTTPTFLFAVVIVAIEQPSAWVISLAIGLISWPDVARLVRAEFRRFLQSDFVLAARAGGQSDAQIILREILPNVLPALIVTASVKTATAMLMESGLAFLGLGDPNRVSWGSMIQDGRDLIHTEWYLSVLPGAAVALAVLSLNLIGDALNDALNPRLRP